MKEYLAARASDETYQLAEGPVWDHLRGRLLWVDIPSGNVHEGRLHGSRITATRTWHVDTTVGAVAITTEEALLVAGNQAVHLLTPEGSSTEIARLIAAGAPRRLNDGKCDPAGRFLVGTLALGDHVQESLFQVDHDHDILVIDDDLQMSNGLAWSPDGHTMYSVDTTPGILWERSYSPESGHWGQRREVLRITDGSLDGICTDANGDLWVAVWGTGEVRNLTPRGELISVVKVPAPYTSCVTFAGPGLDTLVISTAIDDLSTEQLSAHPDSGGLFLVDVDVKGLPTNTWTNCPA